MKTNFIFIFISMFLIPIWGKSQASVDNNNPFTGAFLGWNAGGVNGNLDFRTNNINRMRLMQTGTNTINNYTVANDGFLMLSIDPAVFGVEEPFSLLHLNGADNNLVGPQQLGYRSWMRAGITFTHNSDMMFVGPMRTAGTDRTDAVISWSDNDQPGGTVGPDVLRFLFTGAGNGTTTVSADPLSDQDWDGVETARIMGDARMGVGPLWTNSLLPKRALDVVRRNDAEPQFRLTYNPGTTNDAGTYTDFQTSSQGNLHIRPRINTSTKTTVIGFLAGQGGFANPSPGTTLDVGGITRVRNLPDSSAKSLIIGFQPSQLTQNAEDQFLGRLDFLGDTCLVLNSNGGWTDVCNLGGGGGADLDWEFNGTNVWSAHGNGYPEQSVLIGTNNNVFNSKLSILGGGTEASLALTTGIGMRWFNNGGGLLEGAHFEIDAQANQSVLGMYLDVASNVGSANSTGIDLLVGSGINNTVGQSINIPGGIGLSQRGLQVESNNISDAVNSHYGIDVNVETLSGKAVGVGSTIEAIGFTEGMSVFGMESLVRANNAPIRPIGIKTDVIALRDAVGIEINTMSEAEAGSADFGIFSFQQGDSEFKTGGHFQAGGNSQSTVTSPEGLLHQGVYGLADRAVNNVGVWGEALMGFTGTQFNAGIYGRAPSTNNNWAGFFAGRTYCTLGVWSGSDESIKTNITEIESATEIIQQLTPVHYQLDLSAIGEENSEEPEFQYGFIAQELEGVLPDVVRTVYKPELGGSDSLPPSPEYTIKAVSYDQIIPVLVAGFKEQRTVIDAQQAELEAMQTEMAAMSEAATITESGATLSDLEAQLAAQQEQINLLMEQLAACCSAPIGTPGSGSDKSMNGDSTPTDQLHQNIPNPFKEQTTINFELVSDSQVLLEITDAKGNLVATLVNGSMARGLHRVEWNANGQAPGTYYYSLYTDKELLTKKMIKL